MSGVCFGTGISGSVSSRHGQPDRRVEYVNLRQSMRNGGGPACLRLRVVLTEVEFESVRRGSRVILDQHLDEELKAWVVRNYRERIMPQDLADPSLLHESRTALDELTKIFFRWALYMTFRSRS